ncbi:ABC transporter family substrate-binding protein [Agrococcus sp. ARC_14]|uniref:ABC transporter family substrate-binding protein n=1 Tax=Agrococcus sp. ARC_14 TaxID=2919927 RepID=UPI001F06F698|nr:ABC transporter family substrate-binding protein [Agrococcus sp. ARC_14]MCH1883915.1 ABC transporter family substrate-binding protein [Agrococcus sp. ARC_14]
MKLRTTGIAVAAAAALLLTACAPGGDAGGQAGGDAPAAGQVTGDLNTVNTAEVEPGGEITMAIEKTIQNWNTLSAAGDISEAVWVTGALYPSAFVIQPDGSTLEMNDDLLASAEVVSQDPTVVEYVINEDAVWSDGVPITGDDFILQWQMLNGRDCPDCAAGRSDGLDQVESIEQSEDGRTVTATHAGNFSEWQREFNRLLPAHLAEANGGLYESFSDYFVNTVPVFSGGPYIITDFQPGIQIVLEPNSEWYGEAPNLERVTISMITDTQQTPIAMQNGEIDVMYPQPQVDLLQQVQSMAQQGVSYQMNQSLVMEALVFNHSNSFLSDLPLRQAIATAIDKQSIIDRTVGQFDESVTPLGSAMIMQQQTGYENHTDPLNYGLGDTEAAAAILEEAGYTVVDGRLVTPEGEQVPALRAVYSVGNAVRESAMQVIEAAVAPLGITLALETTDSLGDTMSSIEPYGHDIVLVGYTGSPFLASNAHDRYTTGTGDNPHYSNPEVDALVDGALAATSQEEAIELIGQADELFVHDLLLLPMYQKSTLIAYPSNLGNVRDNPTLSGPLYNLHEWGFTGQ